MASLAVYNMAGQEVEQIELPATFDKDVNTAILHQAIVMYNANKRQGTVDTKTRSEISGSTRKPFRQKGTGRARQGDRRSPLNKKGGIVFGPHPRDFSYAIPKRVRIQSLAEAMKAKIGDKNLICVDELKMTSAKTKDFIKILKGLKVPEKKVLAVIDDATNEVAMSARNIRGLTLGRAVDVNALDFLKTHTVLATKAGIETLLKRLR